MAQGSIDFGSYDDVTDATTLAGFTVLYCPDPTFTIAAMESAVGGKACAFPNAGGGPSAIVLDGPGTPASYDMIIAGWVPNIVGAEGSLPLGQSGATADDRAYYSRSTDNETQWVLRFDNGNFGLLGEGPGGVELDDESKFYRRLRRHDGRLYAAIRDSSAALMGTPVGGWDLDVAETALAAMAIGLVGTLRGDVVDWMSWGTGGDPAIDLEGGPPPPRPIVRNRAYDLIYRPAQTVARPSGPLRLILVAEFRADELDELPEEDGYVRGGITVTFGAPTAGVGANTAALSFGTLTAAVEAAGIALMDSAGNVWDYEEWPSPRQIESTDELAIGELVATLRLATPPGA